MTEKEKEDLVFWFSRSTNQTLKGWQKDKKLLLPLEAGSEPTLLETIRFVKNLLSLFEIDEVVDADAWQNWFVIFLDVVWKDIFKGTCAGNCSEKLRDLLRMFELSFARKDKKNGVDLGRSRCQN